MTNKTLTHEKAVEITANALGKYPKEMFHGPGTEIMNYWISEGFLEGEKSVWESPEIKGLILAAIHFKECGDLFR